MGGSPPLGYDVRDKKLVVNEDEADQVRRLFAAYLTLRSVKELTTWAREHGIRTKIRRRADGTRRSGGHCFSRGNLHALLRYRTYVGEVQHKGNVYPGEHQPIIARDLWEQVQEKLAHGRPSQKMTQTGQPAAALTGLLFDQTGDRLTPTHATKKGRRYHYYVSTRLIEKDAHDPTGWRLPAHKLEQAVCDSLLSFLSNKNAVLDAMQNLAEGKTAESSTTLTHIFSKLQDLIERIQGSGAANRLVLLRPMLDRITVGPDRLQIAVKLNPLLETRGTLTEAATIHVIDVPFTLRQRGIETHLILHIGTPTRSHLDQTLIRLLAKARTWVEDLSTQPDASVKAIARREGLPSSEVSRLLPFAFLSPIIVATILRGEQPMELTAKKLKRLQDLPMDWSEQAKILGFAAP